MPYGDDIFSLVQNFSVRSASNYDENAIHVFVFLNLFSLFIDT